MESMMVFDDRAKRRMGFICFLPVVCFALCFVYYLTLSIPLTYGHPQPNSFVGVINRHYDFLFFILAASAIITAPVFLYCIVILARLKHMNAATKIIWIILLTIIAPISSALFWLLIIKDARKYTPIHPNIA